MGRKSAHNLPPGIHQDQHGVLWATLEGQDADDWRQRYPGRSLPRRKAATLREALKLQRALTDDLRTGRDPNADNPVVAAWLETWIDGKHSLKESTRKRYRQSLTWQIKPLRIGRVRRSQLSHELVEKWIAELRRLPRQDDDERTLDVYTIRNAFALLRAACTTAVERGYLAKNPCAGVELPPLDDEEIHPLTPADVEVLFAVLDTYEKGKPHRNAALYHVALRCGLRKGEIIGLRWKDVDLERGELRVLSQLQARERSGPKRRSRRTIPLTPDMVQVLRAHRLNQAGERQVAGSEWNAEGLVFCSENGTPINQGNLTRQFDSLLRKAKLPDIRFHDLRHTYAALSIAAGVDLYTLSRRMGHSSITVTADRYGHLYQGQTSDAELMDRLLKRA